MAEQSHADDRPSHLVTVWWWALTVATLVVLDDLTFGPLFWAIARLAGAGVAVAAVYAVYVPAQLWVLSRGVTDEPGRLATWFLQRLDLQRRAKPVQENEARVRSRVVGVGSALVLSLLIGGVLPPLLLWRRGWERRTVMQVGVATSVIYATEFALLHGIIPATI